jgi:hypothetical protein
MTKVSVTVEIEFETSYEAAARTALIRLPGDIAHSIQHGVMGLTGVKSGSVKVTKTREDVSTID